MTARQNIFPFLHRHRPSPLLIKIGDFGVSKRTSSDSDTILRTFVGSGSYIAPEIIGQDGEYSPTVDCFSVGCVIYRLVTTSDLFRGPGDILKHTYSGHPKHELRLTEMGCSENCVSFIAGLIKGDPNFRLTAAAGLKHIWVVHCPDVAHYPTTTKLRDILYPELESW